MPGQTIDEDAHATFDDAVLAQACMGPASTVLELGSGWGALARHAIGRHRCRCDTVQVACMCLCHKQCGVSCHAVRLQTGAQAGPGEVGVSHISASRLNMIWAHCVPLRMQCVRFLYHDHRSALASLCELADASE